MRHSPPPPTTTTPSSYPYQDFVSELMLKFILSVCACVRAEGSAVASRHSVPGGHAEASPSPPPLPPSPWQEADLGRAWQRAGLEGDPRSSTPAHWANPLSLCRCSKAWTNTHTRTHAHSHTHRHACTNAGPAEAPRASRCPNAPFLCVTILLPGVSRSPLFIFTSPSIFVLHLCGCIFSPTPFPLICHRCHMLSASSLLPTTSSVIANAKKTPHTNRCVSNLHSSSQAMTWILWNVDERLI